MMTKLKINHVLLALSLSAITVFMGCNDDEEIPKPIASFTFTIDAVTGGIVTFTNTSQNADSYEWNFGDGTFSTLENPQKTYMTNGNYNVSLTATNKGGSAVATQTVTINLIVDMTDTEAPVITLLGASSIEIPIGATFTDPGATANDNVDGNITSNIVVTGSVNTLQPGVYTLKYNVSDAAGNAATEVSRTVTVTFDDGLLTNGDFQNGPTGWIGNGLDVREEGGNKYSFSNVTSAGNPFDVNVSQVLPLQIGNKYKLSFNASTDRPTGRKIIAGIGLNEAPWTNVTNEFTITTTVQRFSAEFVANFGSSNSRVLFDLGADIGVVVLDNVSLELVAENTSALPLNFENGKEVASVFNGASFAVVNDPANASNKAGKITNSGAQWEGVTFFLGTAVNFSTSKVITMRFNTATAGVPVLMKFESGTADPVEVAVTAAITGWQDLTFNFTSATASYKQVTLFVDGPGNTAGDFYIDDIAQQAGSGGTSGCAGTPVPATAFPVTFETCETFLSTFTDAGSISTELAANPSKSGINLSNYSLKVVKAAGTNRWAGFQNTFASNIDLTKTLKLKVYSSKANVVMRFEVNGNPQDPGSGNPPPQFKTIAQANTWVAVEVNFTGIPPSNTGVNQLVIKPDNPDGTDGEVTSATETYYFDDLTLEAGGPGGTDGAFFLENFNNASSIDKWSKLANADNNSNATVTYSATGGVNGTGAILLTLNDPAGGAYIFRYTNAAVNYNGKTNIRIKYDVKVVTPIVSSALHMQTQTPQPGGGVITTNTFDTQGSINSSTFTTISQNVNSIDPAGTLFIIDFNFATGGGGSGAVLIDNVRIEEQ